LPDAKLLQTEIVEKIQNLKLTQGNIEEHHDYKTYHHTDCSFFLFFNHTRNDYELQGGKELFLSSIFVFLIEWAVNATHYPLYIAFCLTK
jgi:hypothetical protein